MSVDLRYSFKLPFALTGRHLEQAIVTPPSPQSEAMRKNYKEIIFPVLCVMVIFICAMLCLVAVVDLVVAPILKELLQDSLTRDWCGVFTRCASQTKMTFVEHVTSPKFWKNIHTENIERRLKSAALLGALIGFGLVAISVFRRRS
ncbi:hypothetical protein [Herbaspirillum huttiense]|uniref:hypothetical protein n=1 Tax=Herbaspirillum huttiense TaxID=863372 RepID=UPI0012FE8F08|nr:hypothetical protein [Herbaspirillum huttiense]